MSFILDQLRKSGKKRELELAIRNNAGLQGREVAAPSRTPDPAISVPQFRIRGIYLLVLLLGLSSALGAFMLLRGSTSHQKSVVGSEAQNQAVTSPAPAAENTGTGAPPIPQSGPQAGPKPDVPVDRVAAMSVQASSITGVTHSKEAPKKAGPPAAGGKKALHREVAATMPPDISAEPHNLREQEKKRKVDKGLLPQTAEQPVDSVSVPELDELAPSVRKALPPIHISSHLHRKNSRLVSINGKIMSEGVTMEDGLFLEEITQEGVILSFRGNRFRVRAY